MVTVLVYDWPNGQTEVQIQWPKEATSGAGNYLASQDRFSNLVRSELDAALRDLSGPARQ